MKDVDAKERGKFQLFTDKAVVMMNKFKKRFS